ARSAGDTLWVSRGNGSVVAGERFGSWPCAWSRLAVSQPVMDRLSRKFLLILTSRHQRPCEYILETKRAARRPWGWLRTALGQKRRSKFRRYTAADLGRPADLFG